MSAIELSNLSSQKTRLALVFTAIIFLVMMVLQGVSLAYKYLDFRREEDQRFVLQLGALTRLYETGDFEVLSNVLERSMRNPARRGGGPIGDGVGRDGLQRLRAERFVIYAPSTGEIIASPFADTAFVRSILDEVIEDSGTSGTFEDNEIVYRFVRKAVASDREILVFNESHFPLQDIWRDLLVYCIFALAVSGVLYIVIRSFIDRTLEPVEENMRDMEDFIHNAGHELKTPIAVAKSALQIARIKKDNAEKIDESIAEMDRMNAIIESLVELSGMRELPNRQAVDPAAVVDRTIEKYSEKIDARHIALKREYESDVRISAHEEYLGILVANLLSNAIKYNKDSGGITVTIRGDRLEIRDTGIGISPENVDRVFERFFQDSEARTGDGWGIGLSLVRRIADLHGWRVSIESEKGVGTKVTVEF